MTNWVRGTGERPPQRTIVLRYKTADAKSQALEELIAHIPFGKQNEVLLECLRIAAPAMLKAMQGEQPDLQVLTPKAPAQEATSVAPKAPPPPAPPAFSSAAVGMFQMSDDKP